MEAAVMWASDTQQEITVYLIIAVTGGDCCERGHDVKDSVWVAWQSWSGTASLQVVMFELNLMKCRMNILAKTPRWEGVWCIQVQEPEERQWEEEREQVARDVVGRTGRGGFFRPWNPKKVWVHYVKGYRILLHPFITAAIKCSTSLLRQSWASQPTSTPI